MASRRISPSCPLQASKPAAGSARWRRASGARRQGGPRCARGRDRPIAHHRKETLHLSAAALDQRCEFGTLRQPHADAVDNDVAGLVKPVLRSQSPLDLDRRPTRSANDLTRHDRTFRTGSAPRDIAQIDTPIRSEHKPGPCPECRNPVATAGERNFPFERAPYRHE